MTVVLMGTAGLVASALVLVAAVAFLGRAERRAAATERDALRSEPPVLGGAERPGHLRRRRWT